MADFKTNSQLIEQGVSKYEAINKVIYLTMNHTGPEVELPEPAILDSLDLLYYVTVNLVHGTVNLILSTDQMEFLQSDPLKAQLSSFPGVNARYKRYESLSRDITLEQRKVHKKFIAILSKAPDMQSKPQTPHKSDHLGWLRDRDHQNIVIDRLYQNRNAAQELAKLEESNDRILDLIHAELSWFE